MPLMATAAMAAVATGCYDSTPDSDLAVLLQPQTSSTVWDSRGYPAPDNGCRRLPLRPIGGSLASVFSDLNGVHMEHARRAGIKPIENSRDAWLNTSGMVHVRSCDLFLVDRLTHSYPYLTEDAATLLHDICRGFADSLASRGGGAYRPKVTSMLRTGSSVRRLRRVNRNASSESAHSYGTTFDLSYSKFICDDTSATLRTVEDLKILLGEIVAGLRAQGRCVVKHERRQGCFHITVCAPTDSLTSL